MGAWGTRHFSSFLWIFEVFFSYKFEVKHFLGLKDRITINIICYTTKFFSALVSLAPQQESILSSLLWIFVQGSGIRSWSQCFLEVKILDVASKALHVGTYVQNFWNQTLAGVLGGVVRYLAFNLLIQFRTYPRESNPKISGAMLRRWEAFMRSWVGFGWSCPVFGEQRLGDVWKATCIRCISKSRSFHNQLLI